MSGIRRHGRGAGTGHPPLNGHGRRGHRPARAYAGPAARRTRKPSDPGAGRRGTAVAENDRLIQNMKTPPHILWSDGPQAIPDRKAGRMIESYLRFSEQAPAPYDDLLRLVPPALAVLAALLLVLAVDQILQLVLRIAFGRAYSVRVPFSVRVGVDLHPDDVGSFSMGYPQWRSAKKDGTRDRRTNDLHVIKNRTLILIDGWKLRGKNPFEAYGLVRDLRRNGQVVVPCQEERLKRSEAASQILRRRDSGSIDDIISAFEDRPTDFEGFCADMFRTLGWTAETTPPTNDGGYDISMHGETGATAIVECKCYARNHHVGRPVVQKLHGANATVGAQEMMVVTTSSFTQGAVEYAAQTGVRLIDGPQLLSLCRRAWPSESSPLSFPTTATWLTDGDIMARIPTDLQRRYR